MQRDARKESPKAKAKDEDNLKAGVDRLFGWGQARGINTSVLCAGRVEGERKRGTKVKKSHPG